MCYKDKCFHCIPVERGCLFIAIITAVTAGVMLVASVVMEILFIADGKPTITQDTPQNATASDLMGRIYLGIYGEVLRYYVVVYIALVALASLVAFGLSAVLCHGIYNRRPGQVKFYFIFGVVITALVFSASVIQLCTSNDTTFGILGLVGCVIYSLFLVLVFQTNVKLRDDLERPQLNTQELSATAIETTNELTQISNVNCGDFIYPRLPLLPAEKIPKI